ncbi:MAG: hypothetical protein KAJ24_03695, partial [Candidatus Aenigmarchaeota archaeon]|nr:hypothetical protein [Candidatus Aenigmarchaeota archaeon]
MPAKNQLTKNRSFAYLVVSLLFLVTFFSLSAKSVPSFAAVEEDCDASSPGYFANNDGCPTPGSYWVKPINYISSSTFQGAFASITASDICFFLGQSNCAKLTGYDKNLCNAKRMVLADISNIASNGLQLDAWIAGADDGDPAFDRLGLSYTSTVEEALFVLEGILVNLSHTEEQLSDVHHVGNRIYFFYEKEYVNNPECIYGPYCGDGNVDTGEVCDNGLLNGILCIPPYDSFCKYCSDICDEVTLFGPFCGDGILNDPPEQ